VGENSKTISEVVERTYVNGKRDYHGRWVQTDNRICLDCGKQAPKEKFPTSGKTKSGIVHYKSRCRECYNNYLVQLRQKNLQIYRANGRKYRWKNRDKINLRLREYRKAIRQRGMDALGNKCVYCGRINPKILSFGHINNDGNEHRRRLRNPDAVYRDWDKRGWPKDEVEIQCYNYNLGGACD
jgi:hypothetical protein